MDNLLARARRVAALSTRETGGLIRELAAALERVTAERDRAWELERRRWGSARKAFGPGVGPRDGGEGGK